MARVDYSELKKAVGELNASIEKMQEDKIDLKELGIPSSPLKIIGIKKEDLVDRFAEAVEAIDEADLVDDYLSEFVTDFFEALPPKEIADGDLLDKDPRRKTEEERRVEKRIEKTNEKINAASKQVGEGEEGEPGNEGEGGEEGEPGNEGEELDPRTLRIKRAKEMAVHRAKNLSSRGSGNRGRYESKLYTDGPISKGVRDPFIGEPSKNLMLIQSICDSPFSTTEEIQDVIGKTSESNTRYLQNIVLKTIYILSRDGKLKDEFAIRNPFIPEEPANNPTE